MARIKTSHSYTHTLQTNQIVITTDFIANHSIIILFLVINEMCNQPKYVSFIGNLPNVFLFITVNEIRYFSLERISFVTKDDNTLHFVPNRANMFSFMKENEIRYFESIQNIIFFFVK